MRRAWFFAFILLVLGACDDGGEPEVDAGRTDAATPDGGLEDAEAPETGWRSEPSLPMAMQEIAVAAHRDEIWVAGGFVGSTVVDVVVRFDPTTGEFHDGPTLPAPRHHAVLVSFGEDLYLLGGMQTTSFDPLDTAWVLRGDAAAWEAVAPLPEDRGAGAAGRVGGLIVYVGGNDSRGGLASRTLIYDPNDDRWDMGAPIPTAREHLAAVSYEGELHVFAGRRNSLSSNRDELEIYDPIADTWREGPSLLMARGGFCAAHLGDSIYAVGGEQPDRALDEVERFDLAEERFVEVPPVPTRRHGHGCASLGGRLYVIGGADAPLLAPVAVIESYAP